MQTISKGSEGHLGGHTLHFYSSPRGTSGWASLGVFGGLAACMH